MSKRLPREVVISRSSNCPILRSDKVRGSHAESSRPELTRSSLSPRDRAQPLCVHET